MTKNVVLTGIGRDRVGIVAGLSRILYELGCNLLDSSMTLLRGQFAVILMVQIPDNQTVEGLSRKLAELKSELGLDIFVRELAADELQESEDKGEPYIVSVYGADRPGIVATVTAELARLGANITDVETKRTSGASSQSLFLMVLEISVPQEITEEKLAKDLKEVSARVNCDISLQSLVSVEL